MTPQGRLALLHSFRLSLEALIAEEEAETAPVQPPAADPSACPHCGAPEEQVQDTSTLDGVKRSRCRVCREEWERP